MRFARYLRLGLLLGAVACATALVIHERHRLRQMALPLWTQTIHDIPYGTFAENRLDIMRPRWPAEGLRPAVVVFHGGGWMDGDRGEMRDRVCRRYLQNGFVVVNVGYRQGAIPPAAEDAAGALQWFCARVSSYGVDGSRIVVTGESAGAHLALLAALKSGARIAAVVNFYGVTDLTRLLDRPAITRLLPGQDLEPAARRLSPVSFVHRGMPPVLSIHGTADQLIPLEQTALLTRSIRDAGGEASETFIEGAGHGFSAKEQDTAYDAVFRFLALRGIIRPFPAQPGR